jgi:hypothetical protein
LQWLGSPLESLLADVLRILHVFSVLRTDIMAVNILEKVGDYLHTLTELLKVAVNQPDVLPGTDCVSLTSLG